MQVTEPYLLNSPWMTSMTCVAGKASNTCLSSVRAPGALTPPPRDPNAIGENIWENLADLPDGRPTCPPLARGSSRVLRSLAARPPDGFAGMCVPHVRSETEDMAAGALSDRMESITYARRRDPRDSESSGPARFCPGDNDCDPKSRGIGFLNGLNVVYLTENNGDKENKAGGARRRYRTPNKRPLTSPEGSNLLSRATTTTSPRGSGAQLNKDTLLSVSAHYLKTAFLIFRPLRTPDGPRVCSPVIPSNGEPPRWIELQNAADGLNFYSRFIFCARPLSDKTTELSGRPSLPPFHPPHILFTSSPGSLMSCPCGGVGRPGWAGVSH
ncbi:hypothetical protein EYF80_039057 [Liparis tanakae]|uniref:Uncharacterized protein n=1 Tax=Liparis tanakae TaxID=230148 RepID=A0A4Z2GAU7_9TELE|nr:hypothetical protein EYF80_039057 [Liparis tanakae]